MWVAGDIHTVTGLVSPEMVISFTVCHSVLEQFRDLISQIKFS